MSRRDIAIDLGTANTLVYQQGVGIVYDEPTVVAVDARTGQIAGVGRQAWGILGDGPGHLSAVRPLHRGAITDFEAARQMLRLILRQIGLARFPRPKALVCVPSSLTPVERRAVEEATAGAGAGAVSLMEEPLAAAIGAGLPIQDPVGNMIVDVGGGNAEFAMVAMGGVVTGKSIRVGGFDMDQAIIEHIRKRHGAAIGEMTAERLKIELGSAYPAADARDVEVPGRDLASGMPIPVAVSPGEIREILGPIVEAIVDAARRCLSESPPELAHDVLETGLFLTGGGAMLRGLEMRIAQECEVPVHVTEFPLATVVMGAGRLLDYLPEYRSSFLAGGRRQ